MESIAQIVSTFVFCGTVLAIAAVVALSLPKSRLRAVLTEFCGWAFMALCAVWAISPVDLFPEAALGPFGLVDDLGAVFLGWQSSKAAMKARQERQQMDE